MNEKRKGPWEQVSRPLECIVKFRTDLQDNSHQNQQYFQGHFLWLLYPPALIKTVYTGQHVYTVPSRSPDQNPSTNTASAFLPHLCSHEPESQLAADS